MVCLKDIKVVAFDCDGVLFDTAQSNRAYYNQILNHCGKPNLSDEQFAFIHMHTLTESIAYLFDDEASRKKAYVYRDTMQPVEFYKLMKLEPGFISLATKIRPHLKTAIATNRTDSINGLLDEFGLKGYFDMVVTSRDVKFAKPNPEPLLKILEYFHIGPRQAIYVGDSQLDELAATSAGMPLVAYRNRQLEASYHIESLKELETILCI